jgi:hypothetical protein
MNVIDSVGGFFGRKEDCIVVEVVFVRRICSSFLFLVHVSVTLLILVLCPFDA